MNLLHLPVILLFTSSVVFASTPPPEKLLPDDTLLVVTIPDFSKVRGTFKASSQNQAWTDPAFKPFKDDFLAKWKEQVTDPLERELDINLTITPRFPRARLLSLHPERLAGSRSGIPR